MNRVHLKTMHAIIQNLFDHTINYHIEIQNAQAFLEQVTTIFAKYSAHSSYQSVPDDVVGTANYMVNQLNIFINNTKQVSSIKEVDPLTIVDFTNDIHNKLTSSQQAYLNAKSSFKQTVVESQVLFIITRARNERSSLCPLWDF